MKFLLVSLNKAEKRENETLGTGNILKLVFKEENLQLEENFSLFLFMVKKFLVRLESSSYNGIHLCRNNSSELITYDYASLSPQVQTLFLHFTCVWIFVCCRSFFLFFRQRFFHIYLGTTNMFFLSNVSGVRASMLQI